MKISLTMSISKILTDLCAIIKKNSAGIVYNVLLVKGF